MKANLSTRFFLADKKVKDGKSPIYLRITYSRKKAEHFTGIYINKANWSGDKQRAKKDNQVNNKLSSIEKDIGDIHYLLEKENKPISAGLIKDIYTGKNEIEKTLLTYYDAHVQDLKKKNEVAKNTVSRYLDTYDHLKNFLSRENKSGLLIRFVDFKLLNDFDVYLKTQVSSTTKQALERNTVNKHHSRLRTILIKAVNESQLVKNPYKDFKFKYTPSKRTFLTKEELERIQANDLGNNQSLIKVRDIFIFSVYTGLRFQDAQNLKSSQVIIDEKQGAQLDFTQEKTKETVRVPLFKQALEIIEKYKTSESKITGYVLPKISNQKFNAYLKIIGELSGIEKTLSHHVARHTCATTILLSNQAPIEAVSKWLGHTQMRTTQIYAKITNDYLQQIANQVASKI